MPHGQNQSALSRIGKGLVSFGTGIPQIELDRQATENEFNETQIRRLEQNIASDERAAIKDQQLLQLSRAAFDPNNPDKDAALNQLFMLDPGFVNEVKKGLRLDKDADLTDQARRAAEIFAQPTLELRHQVINRQIAENPTIDMSETEQLKGMTFEQMDVPLRVIQAAALTPAQRQTAANSAISGGASKLGQSVVTTDTEGNLSFATPVLTGDVVETQTTPIGGKIVSRSAGETSAQRQARDIDTAGGKTTAIAVSTRDQNFIDVGQRQADGTAIIRRGIQLLDVIKTGAPQAIVLAAKNLMGIAGADETELNANLGKAVLSQLRTTFGAQFTENEGRRLAALEAAFGKSTEGNRRLLEQTLEAMERDARRGIDAARRNEDQFSIDEIEKALQFSLDPEAGTIDDGLDGLSEFMTPEERALFQ